MLGNYLIIAFRNLLRNKLFSLINILGLAVGLASCLVCYLHLSYELGYDNFHEHKSEIYRVITGDVAENDYWVMMAAPLPPVLKAEFPEVEEYCRMASLSWDPKVSVRSDRQVFNEQNFFLVDPSFLSVFSFKFLKGDPSTALTTNDGLIITQSNAEKYFGNEDPMGKVITVNEEFIFRITGIIEDAPHNSHLQYSFLASFENLARAYGDRAPQSWGGYNYFAYLKLVPGANVNELKGKIRAYNFKASEDREISFADLDLQKMQDIHFMDNRGNLKPAYNITYIYIFWALAAAVLFIAIINYINLTTARSQRRIKEVGLRKTVGAPRGKIITQFLAETLVTALVALALAIILLELLMPLLNKLLENRIEISYTDPAFMGIVLGITLLAGLIAGTYIAFFVSSFEPGVILKGEIVFRKGSINLRKALLFLQFAVSTVLIISSLVIRGQMQYIREMDLGFNKEHVIDIHIFKDEAKGRMELYKQEILQSPMVISAGASAFQPGSANFNQSVKWEGQEEDMSMFLIPVDKDYLETMQFQYLEGDPNYIPSMPDSAYTWILNETARKLIGWEQAYGKQFTAFSSSKSMRPVAGVIRDFNFMSLHHEVGPLVLVVGNAFDMDRVSVRVRAEEVPEALMFLRDKFREVMPDIPFEYSFFEDSVDHLYRAEIRSGNIVSVLTAIIIGIALFGLLGLISFSLEERTREIAIRKVHGIGIPRLSILLTRNYIILVLIASVLAVPAAWYIMDRWLMNFAYRTSLSPAIFIFTILLTLLLVFLTIAFRTLKSARSNPADALKYE